MSKKTNDGRTFNVSVIGLSGVDNEKSLYGVGKSCLCNRFVRPLADEYLYEHLSIFSSTDFAGRVLNNDHYLYWGSVVKKSDDGSDLCFQIVEQTEFIEDSTLTTLSRGGQIPSYSKRCTAVKLQSQEKLMYISRDQVALQTDYEQVPLPGGKFNVDGFVCVFDVSARGRSDEQDLLFSSLLNALQKTKKPFVVAATKCDDLRKSSLDECTKLFTSKKLTNVPIIEVSAQENVNVDLLFQLLAQLIEKGRVRSRITPYNEAHQLQKEKIGNALENYQKLVESNVNDFRAIWKNTKKVFESEAEYLTVRDLCGIDSCKKVFNKHIRRLKKEKEDVKLEEYVTKLPTALDDLFPTLSSVDSFQQDWPECQNVIRSHRDFDKWFMQLSNGSSWQDSENLMSTNFLIPIDVFSRNEANACFEKHVEKLKEAELCSRMKKEFKRLLQLTPQIQPGTPWEDGVLLLKNEESYKYLSDSDKLDIFETYQSEITAQGKIDFQELLFESAKLFANYGPSSRPTVEDLHQISNELQKDERFRRLDKLPNEREKLLWNHIALLHSPTRCLAGQEKCMDQLIQDVVATTDQRPLSSFLTGSNDTFESDDSVVTLIIVGSEGLGKEFAQGVEKRCYGEHSEYPFENKLYELDIKVVEDDVNTSDVFAELDDILTTGLCCVFSSRDTLNYVESYLEKTMGQSDDILSEDVPLVLVLAQDPKEKDVQDELRTKAEELVKRYRCVFIDIHISHFYRDQLITDTQVDEAIKNILIGIKMQTRSRCTSEDLKEPDPDLRILLCANCGDPYPVELILGPLFTNQSCTKCPNRNDSVMLETFVGSERKKVMITFTSYHRAYSLNYQKFHGYILVYSAVRSASLSTLSVFASSIPTIPIQVLATTGSYSGASVVFHSNVAKTLLADGTNLASKLCAKFQTTSPQFQYQAGAFAVFFNRVWERKKESEAAYAEHLLTLSDTLPRRKHDPLPEVPPSPRALKNKRDRSFSGRHYETPNFASVDIDSSSSSLAAKPSSLEFSVVDDGGLSPYAVVKRSSFPSRTSDGIRAFTSTPNAASTEDVNPYASSTQDVNPYASSTQDVNPYASSTQDVNPYASSTHDVNPYASSTHDVNPYASSTPLRKEILEQKQSGEQTNFEHLYSKVDMSMKRKAAEAEDISGSREPCFVENRHPRIFEDSDKDVPPPVPERSNIIVEEVDDNDEDANAVFDSDKVDKDDAATAEPGYATIPTTMSNNHDEGYSTVDETLHRGAKIRPQSCDPYEMKMRDKIKYFGVTSSPTCKTGNRSFPSDSLQRLRHSKAVPSLIKQFSNSAPLAQAEESEVPDYASVKDLKELRRDYVKANRHSTIPELSTNSENVVLRLGSKDTSRNVKSADEFMMPELIGNAATAATQKRLENRRSPQRRTPTVRTNEHSSSNSDQVSAMMQLRTPHVNYSLGSDDGQTADDEGTIDRAYKLRIPSIRRMRKNSPTPVRRTGTEKRAPRDRKRKEQDKSHKEKTISRSRSVPRNFNPLNRRTEGNVMTFGNNKAKYNSLSIDPRATSPQWPEDGESVTEEDTEDDSTLSRKRKKTRDEKEAEKILKREEKKQKKRQEKVEKETKKKEDRMRKKEEEFRRKKMSRNNSKYFGQPLSEICPEDSLVPLFLDRCIKFVEARGMEVKGIYRVSGNKADVESVQQMFEQDPSKDFAELGLALNAVTSALKSFFSKLPGALIPSTYYDGIISATMIMDAHERFAKLRNILKLMPPHNFAVFKRIMFHLNRVTEYKSVNMMESRNLAIVFWPTLAPPVIASIDTMARSMNMCLFVQTYIEHCEELFKDD